LQCVAVCCSVYRRRNVLWCLYIADMCCSALQCVAVRCSVLQCVAVCCSALQCVAVALLCYSELFCVIQGSFVFFRALLCSSGLFCVIQGSFVYTCRSIRAGAGRKRRTARMALCALWLCPCCSVLQCVAAVCCSAHVKDPLAHHWAPMWSTLHCVALGCGVMRCVAMCGNVLQCDAAWLSKIHSHTINSHKQSLQCVAAWCSVLQCTTVRCNALQRVAARCSERHRWLLCAIDDYYVQC